MKPLLKRFYGNSLQPGNCYQKRNEQQQTQTDHATHAQRQTGNPDYQRQYQSSNSDH